MSTVKDAKFEELRHLVMRMPGQRLPGERELAEQLVISRPRLRSILAALQAEGLVQRRHGSGTYALRVEDAERPLGRVALWIDSSLKLADDPFFSHVVECLQDELQGVGAQCSIQKTHSQSVPHSGDDGIITLGTAGCHVIENWKSYRPPLVSLFITDDIPLGVPASILQIENRRAGSLAARRLVEHKVDQVWFFGRRQVPAVQERLAGVEAELHSAGMPLDVVECSLNYAAGVEVGRTTRLPEQQKVGIVAANDWLAVGLHAGLLSQNAVSARQFKIVSFDGLPLTDEPILSIESLAVPIEAMARDAVAELVRLRQPGALGRSIQYPLFWRNMA
ncbi:MAG: GntR family transcriptional regulator [Abitibacteriaceae bacterium]|nr:GntR family transcriptional regulator [Abditibacteriaceae bacterium]